MDYTMTIPDETLSYIFLHLTVMSPPYRSRSRAANFGWIRVTFMNQRWRRVALDHAVLWTTLDGQIGSQWMKEFVSRSKGMLLSVSGWGADKHTFYNSVLSAHHKRVASLYLNTSFNRPRISAMETYLQQSFDSLEELVISNGRSATNTIHCTNVLLRNTPRLRRLDLVLVSDPTPLIIHSMNPAEYDWKYPFFTHLMSLKLRGYPTLVVSPQFLDALRQMHSLNELILSAHRSQADVVPLLCGYRCSKIEQDVIYLPNMQSLIVKGCLELPLHLFRHVRLPQNARLAIVPDHSAHAPTQLSTYYRILSREVDEVFCFHPQTYPFSCAPSFSWAYLCYDSLRDPNKTVVTVGLAHVAPPLRVAASELNPATHESLLGIDLAVALRDNEAIMFLSRLSTSNVRILALQDQAGMLKKRQYLSSFPNVQCLTVRMSYSLGSPFQGLAFLETLKQLPSLRVVLFHGDEFNLRLLLQLGYNGPNTAPTVFGYIEDVLRVRERMGAPLYAVCICLAEEIALVRAGRVSETSCEDMRKDIVQEAVRVLEGMQGVEIVSKDFQVDTFATY